MKKIIISYILVLVSINSWTGLTGSLSPSAVWSDIRLKTDVQPLYKYSLSDLMKLEAVSFKYKDSDRTSLGFIAQEVEKVIPEAIGEDNKGYKYIFMDQLLAVTVKTTQQQQLLINTQRQQINELQSQVLELSQEVERIKKAFQ